MVHVRDVAQAIVESAAAQEAGRSPFYVLKMLYLAYGASVADGEGALFEANFEAWRRGPVVREIYDLQPRSDDPIVAIEGGDASRLSADDRALVDAVVFNYGFMTFTELEQECHGSAWIQARGNLPTDAHGDTVIDREAIEDEFKKRANDAAASVLSSLVS